MNEKDVRNLAARSSGTLPPWGGGDHAAVPLSRRARTAVLAAACLGLVFDGVELGLMPVASLSVSQSLLGAEYSF